MENLLNALKNADRICNQANAHFERAAQAEREIAALLPALKKAKTKWILIGIAIWYGIGFAANIFSVIPVLGPILLVVGNFGGMVAGIYIGTNGFKKTKADSDAKLNQITRQIEEEKAKGQQIFDANYAAVSFLPDDYWHHAATGYLVKAIASGRVTTLGEALDRYDAQVHRGRVEETNAQILAQQQAQSAHLKSIDKTGKVNAAANVANAVFNIASRM